ncbi:MAG: 16S rRNA (cytosine(967)-C(5))-methyltransferase RsmB [Eubacteriales bacterium]|nr:16S rRNA (cytosine(967)-C(5))-methyltransferase RsmB [Eubacteriales bacterium]MDD4389337.1 16S rRNA (cytosine(967)-C(5))-methyltransferase RsmB [Eubacteriales bacterium]
MDANRKTAYHTLMDVEVKSAYSNISLNHNIILGKPSSPAFVRELVYGALKNKILLDYTIDKLVVKGIDSIKVSDLTILRMGIYQLGYMNSVPEYAAVNESVSLAKRFSRGREGFINAILRSYINDRYSLQLPDRDEDEVKYLSIKYSYNPWIIEMWLKEYDVAFVEELLIAGNKTPELTIRLNWLKVLKPDLIKLLEEKGFEVTQGKICDNALHVKGSALLESNLYKEGMFSVQDEASMLVSVMLDPKHGDTIVDVCAAPGGKTLAVAERMNNTGQIIAMDIYKRKLGIIDKEAKRLGVKNIVTKTWDATKTDPEMVEKADRVLVDAPCSGLGVIRRKPEIKYKKQSTEMEMLPKKQLSILKSSARYVKPGGILIYSSCTINKAENQDVIDEFLRTSVEFKKLEAIQLLPNVNGTDGFFICKMQREEIL